jgi:hypothetical protein
MDKVGQVSNNEVASVAASREASREASSVAVSKANSNKDEENQKTMKIKEDKEDQASLPLSESSEKLHAIRKFKIDDQKVQEFFENEKGRLHEFFVSLGKYLPDYFRNNAEMKRYIDNFCYVGLRVKVIYSREQVEDKEEEYGVPHNRKRRYLAQRLTDLTDIFIDQAVIIEGEVSEYV